MQITIRVDGKPKTYTMGYTSMMMARRSFEIKEKIKDFANPSTSELDMMVDYIVEAFDHQFTRAQLYQGINYKGCVKRLNQIISDISDILMEAVDEMGE